MKIFNSCKLKMNLYSNWRGEMKKEKMVYLEYLLYKN